MRSDDCWVTGLSPTLAGLSCHERILKKRRRTGIDVVDHSGRIHRASLEPESRFTGGHRHGEAGESQQRKRLETVHYVERVA